MILLLLLLLLLILLLVTITIIITIFTTITRSKLIIRIITFLLGFYAKTIWKQYQSKISKVLEHSPSSPSQSSPWWVSSSSQSSSSWSSPSSLSSSSSCTGAGRRERDPRDRRSGQRARRREVQGWPCLTWFKNKKNFHFLNIQPQDIFKRNYPGGVLDIVLPGFANDDKIPLLSPL